MKRTIIIFFAWVRILLCIPVNIVIEIVIGVWAFMGTPAKGFKRGLWRAASLMTDLDLYKLKGGKVC